MPNQNNFEVFPWNANFETGIPLVDEQHKKLVHLVNSLAANLSLGAEDIKLLEVFDELASYAAYHFASEEQIWHPRFKDDKWYIEHKHTHDSFLPRVLELKAEETHAPYEKVIQDILQFLVGWLVYHILDGDRRMAKVLRALDDGLTLEGAKERANQEMSGLMNTFVSTIFKMYQDLTSRSLALIKETNERIKTQEALLTSELEKKGLATLLSTMEQTIEAMARAIEIRSPYTAGHHRRVAALTQAIAKGMGLSADEIQGCYLAASIHDLGEIQIPSQILVKPGKLSPTEFKMVQQHSQAGYDILKEIEFPWPIAQIIYQHHERLDGSGYPNQLKGDQILLGAKILAVADIIEAMSSHRPYRPARGVNEALAEIQERKGISLDAGAVDICIELFRNKSFEFPK